MSTANKRVERALNLLGATSPIKKARPEVINLTFETLVEMLEYWGSQNINTGITIPQVIGDELNEPPQISMTIDYNLAITVAAYVQKTASQDVTDKAIELMEKLRRQYSPQPQTKYPDTLQLGSGNKTRPLGFTFYPEPDELQTDSGDTITL